MFDGMHRRVVSLWFPRLASDRALRLRPVEGPFALTHKDKNANRLYCLNLAAEQAGLFRGMSFSDARSFCFDLVSRPADSIGDARFLNGLRRWAMQYSPWVGLDGSDGLCLDITGSAHLWGGEDDMLGNLRQRLMQVGITALIGVADTPGAAWALARSGGLDTSRADARGVFVFRFEDAALVEGATESTLLDKKGVVPVVYEIDLRDPASFFVTQNFPVQEDRSIWRVS